MGSIAENVARVRERMEAAAGGRRVLLVAASKMNGADRVREAVAAGVDACGENRVQELVGKARGARLRRRAAALYRAFAAQQGQVPRRQRGPHRIRGFGGAAAGHRRAGKEAGRRAGCAARGEHSRRSSSKSGTEPDRLPELLEVAAGLEAVRVRGLMSIPPISAAPGANRPYFARMRELFVDIGGKKYDNTSMDFLSMGMSGDFEDAIAEGANMVRVGSAIFGVRDYGAGR